MDTVINGKAKGGLGHYQWRGGQQVWTLSRELVNSLGSQQGRTQSVNEIPEGQDIISEGKVIRPKGLSVNRRPEDKNTVSE